MNPLIERYGGERRWVNWRPAEVENKITKVPYSPITGRKASATDPATWSTYEEAEQRDSNLGIIFASDRKLLGVDIDHCLNEGRIQHEKVKEIEEFLAQSNTYTEISPSMTGLHIFLSLTEPIALTANRNGNFECYIEKRYFTVTGTPYGLERPIREGL